MTVQYAGLADWILCRLSSSSEPSVIDCVCDGAREFGLLGLIRERAGVSCHPGIMSRGAVVGCRASHWGNLNLGRREEPREDARVTSETDSE
jgi:hypothetical protein